MFSVVVVVQSFAYDIPHVQHTLLALLALLPIVSNAAIGYFSDGTALYTRRFSPKKSKKND